WQDFMYAFVSYQTQDRVIAGKIKALLAKANISAFLAHEDITVSEEWRLKILAEIAIADFFICILSASYYQSPWCLQESGIAAFRSDMIIIPLSIDGTIPQGFIGHVQSTRINPEYVSLNDLIPGIAKRNTPAAIDAIIEIIGTSGSYRGAEANFELILPYSNKMSDAQAIRLLEKVAVNGQVHHAGLCANKYIPPFLEKYGGLIAPDTLKYLQDVCARYA
ncbi:MAG: toll/interleukin-1 receptor domain-containing protein, partial [Bacteroidota bacterium]